MLFRNKKRQLPPLISDSELELATGINFDNVVEYLVGLSGDDYTKICQVAAVYREADHQAFKVLGIENEPTTFIKDPEPESIDPVFLDIPEKPKRKRGAAK